MCGLAGIFSSRGSTGDELNGQVGAMIGALVHRGPDDSGTWMDPAAGIALGFRRLSIVDLSPLGHQPMRSPNGRFTMVFNGEVYNAVPLARELAQLGHRFRGHSDTEVILAAFEEWGIAAATSRFVGMFAIALWDARERRLHLIRDRLGKKPLFVHQHAGIVAFGSELKALMALPSFQRALDPAALSAYLRFYYVPAPLSIFQSTRKVGAGCILTIDDPGAPLPADQEYWSARDAYARAAASPFIGSDDEITEQTATLLRDAVAMRAAHADVPVGAFLSGGIDSSLVVALMQSQSMRRVKTYTIGFAEKEYDEAAHAEAVARHLGTEHTTLRLGPDEALSIVPTLPQMFDEPFADISQIPTFLVSRLARSEVTVALSGDGGDEVFGGYNRYVWGSRLYQALSPVPAGIRTLAGRGLTAVSPQRWDKRYRAVSGLLPASARFRLPGEKLHKIGALMTQRTASDFYLSLVSSWRDPQSIATESAPDGAFEAVMRSNGPRSFVERMMLADLVTYLPDNNLAKVDRASMAVSLEVRVPLVDHRLVEWSFRLPRTAKIRGGETKWILRQVLHSMVPRALVEREKMGFDVPIGAWLRGPLREWADSLLQPALLDAGGVLRSGEIRRRWDDHVACRANHGTSLWTVLMLQAWRQHWNC